MNVSAAVASVDVPVLTTNLVYHLDASDIDGDGFVEGSGEAGLTNHFDGLHITVAVDKGLGGIDFYQPTLAKQHFYNTNGFGFWDHASFPSRH